MANSHIAIIQQVVVEVAVNKDKLRAKRNPVVRGVWENDHVVAIRHRKAVGIYLGRGVSMIRKSKKIQDKASDEVAVRITFYPRGARRKIQ